MSENAPYIERLETLIDTLGKQTVELVLERDQLLRIQGVSLATIEELRHHGADIQTVVTWLHTHAPERFDLSGQTSMGGLICQLLNEWLALRQNASKASQKSQENGAQS